MNESILTKMRGKKTVFIVHKLFVQHKETYILNLRGKTMHEYNIIKCTHTHTFTLFNFILQHVDFNTEAFLTVFVASL